MVKAGEKRKGQKLSKLGTDARGHSLMIANPDTSYVSPEEYMKTEQCSH
jgi:hypothetical protein